MYYIIQNESQNYKIIDSSSMTATYWCCSLKDAIEHPANFSITHHQLKTWLSTDTATLLLTADNLNTVYDTHPELFL